MSPQVSSAKGKNPSRRPVESRPRSRIVGTGEMAELIRGYEWTKTPLGPVDSWSDTLITTVNLLLASRHPMFLWWGPELIQFYNDGYRPSIRADKHPSAVGQRGQECWPEIWPIIGPQIEAVMNQGESTWNINQLVPINRNGKLEEVFWTYGYSPVRGKAGNVEATLVVCSETTEQVLGERRLRVLLSIAGEPSSQDPLAGSQRIQSFAQTLVQKLSDDPADLPFAALYLCTQGEIVLAGSTASGTQLAEPANWPLAEVVHSKVPSQIQDLQQRFGDVVCEPWPEPVTGAYILPLPMPGSPMQAALVSGISPRLPFDASYETFLHLIGTRIAGLLQSELHEVERAHAAERFSRLANANPFGTVIGGLGGEVKYMNPALLKALGYSEAEVSTGTVRWNHLTPPEYAGADARAIEQLRATGRCDAYEKAYIAKDGRHVPILMGAAIIDAGEGNPEIAAFVTDLTPLKTAEEALREANDALERKVADRTAALEAEIADRKRAETSLRELTGRLLRAQDEERRYMARELHDHAGQTLTALGMNLAALMQVAGEKDRRVTELAAQSRELSEALSKEIRTLSYLLHPPLLDEVGLGSALQWFVNGFSERSSIKVDLELPDDFGRLPNQLELVVFRIVQESLTNIHRHSGSASASIHARRSEGAIRLQIRDRGKGISPEKMSELKLSQSGVGLRGMEERVRQFGGTLEIASSSEGTTVTVSLPLTLKD